jgi:hypothetical protein
VIYFLTDIQKKGSGDKDTTVRNNG